MKRLFFLLSLLPGAAFSQIAVNGVSLDSIPDLKVIQLIVGNRDTRRDQDIVVDYGQAKDVSISSRITFGKSRESKQIRSTVEAINIFENNGWEYVDTTLFPVLGTVPSHTLYLTFRRKKDSAGGR